jgi:hypothetical protein
MFDRKWIAALVLALPWAAQAERPQAMYEMNATGEIEIGPDGSVHDYRLQSDLKPVIAAIVDKEVRSWKFEPILVEGKPVIGKTKLRLALSAVPAGADEYKLKIDNVWFGEPERAQKMVPPKYPMNAVYANLDAKVVLVLKLDPEGQVIDVFPEQTSLSATGSEPLVKRWRKVFEKASITAARKWKFNTTERVNGRAMESLVRVPVSFTLSDTRDTEMENKWNRFVPGPINPLPWVHPGSVAVERRDDLQDGEAQSLSSRFKLKDDVVGRML